MDILDNNYNWDDQDILDIWNKTDSLGVTLTIGRNVGFVPMSDAKWTNFKNRTKRLVKTIYTEATTTGVWINSDNCEIHEESFIVYGTTEMSELDLLAELHLLTQMYQQDAIGYLIGHAGLVEG